MITTNESKEDYLERILRLQEKGNLKVHAVDIAESMAFSKASVSIALKKLEEAGLVSVGEKQVITLTEEGRKIAKKIYERHQVIGEIFISLGVPKDVAYEDACKVEHDLSDETFQARKAYYLTVLKGNEKK